MIQDSLKVAVREVVNRTNATSDDSINWWMWIALAELGLISFLLISRKIGTGNERKRQFKKDSLNQDVDFNNVIESSFHSTALYNTLKVRCHPDRFPDVDKNVIADALFQEITRNKRNLKRLTELKIEAEKQLNITF